MAAEYLVNPKPPPPLNVPKSDKTVKVSCIDSTGRFRIPMGPFIQPEYAGKDLMTGPCLPFLIEHPSQGAIMFDLGIRKDWEKLPSYPLWVERKWYINVVKNVATILKENGVDVDGGAIKAIVLSHHHWDHVGDASTFPGSTELVVGPGFKNDHLPGYPTRKESTMLETDFQGRNVREINFKDESNGLKIGRFNAVDYFGDGSFYLLETPGHTAAHMCGFARTSTSPDTFVYMGGDAGHHNGEFRPNEYLPLPKELDPSPLKKRAGVCPGHLFEEIHAHGVPNKPIYHCTNLISWDKTQADWTLAGMEELDAHDNVLILLAHDDSVIEPEQFDFYPKSMNDWYRQGVGKKVKWLFLKDLEPAIEAKQNGKDAFTWGKYP